MLNPASAAERIDRLAARHGGRLSLAQLVDAGLDRLPLPGSGGGGTLQRWQVLAAVAAHDVALARLYEGHTDALAILAELNAPPPQAGTRWGTWCAEPAAARLAIRRQPDGSALLSGRKAWCAGAPEVTHAVVSGFNPAGDPWLAAVALDAPGVAVTREGWAPVGMAVTHSVDVRFDDVPATPLGLPGALAERPGFWHGSAGIAACWWGGAVGLARRARALAGPDPDAHRQAHLGAIDVALAPVAALLREAAAQIDRDPQTDATGAQALALRCRLAAEACATEVVARAGRALGATPLCRDAGFARTMADLPVFIRQSGAERDLAALGRVLLAQPEPPWPL